MKAMVKGFRRREEGQALVELALVLPLLLLLIFGVIDFGIAINQYNDATNLSNIGAREATVWSNSSTEPTCTPAGQSTPQTMTSLVQYIQCMGSQDNSALANAQVMVTDTNSGGTYTDGASGGDYNSGDTISVKVCTGYSWLKLLTGGEGRIGGMNLTSSIDSTAYMRQEAGTGNTSAPSWITTGTSTC